MLRLAPLVGLLLIARPLFAQTAEDAVLGKQQFGQCRACHTEARGGPDAVGPNLFGVYGSKAATRRKKFAYSSALKASGVVWNDTSLDRWLSDPAAMVKGTKMEFIGLPRKVVRQHVIAYLKTLK